jgi:hypothetical protein
MCTDSLRAAWYAGAMGGQDCRCAGLQLRVGVADDARGYKISEVRKVTGRACDEWSAVEWSRSFDRRLQHGLRRGRFEVGTQIADRAAVGSSQGCSNEALQLPIYSQCRAILIPFANSDSCLSDLAAPDLHFGPSDIWEAAPTASSP